MRFSVAVAVLLLAALTSAAEPTSRNNKQKSEGATKTEKRDLAEGNSGVEKRLAVLPTALPSESPGIVYADRKGPLADKSPIQQVYATPVPQLSKISDVLTGHGPAFPAAIASHLYSPISVYQPKLATPTTYEVSAPVASQLAYAEKISYQNPVQFTTQVLYNQQPQFPKIDFPRYNAVQVQQAFQQPQNPRLFTHPQTFQAPQVSQVVLNQQQPQFQNPQYQNGQNPQAIYSQVQQQLAQLAQTVQPQPGVVYARQENIKEAPRVLQKQVNNLGCCGNGNKPQEKSVAQQNTQPPAAAVSFASFSQAQPTYTQQQPQKQAQAQSQNHQVQNQYQLQPQPQQQPQFVIQIPSYQYQARPDSQAQEPRQYQAQEQPQPQYQGQSQPQIQYQPQPQPQLPIQYQLQYQPQPQIQYQPQPQIQYQPQPQIQYQPQPQIQYQPQPQIQYQSQPQIQYQVQAPAPLQMQSPHYQPQFQYQQPQFIAKLESPSTNSIATPVKPDPARPLAYVRPQEYHYQPQAYQGTQQPGLAFPAVQYFGKFAQEIFGGHKQNQ